MPKRQKASNLRHSIGALGVNHALPGEIRAERLEDRLNPKVPFPHRHDFFQLCLITSGEGWHEIDFQKHTVKANRLFVMKPGQVHDWFMKAGTKGYLIEFTDESIQKGTGLHLLSQFSASPDVLQLNSSQGEILKSLFELMLIEFKKKEKFFDVVLLSHLTALGVSLYRTSSLVSSSSEEIDLVSKFRRLVDQNYQKELRVSFYAKALGMTPKALTMKLSRMLKRSPRSMIQDRLLLEAKRLLLLSDKSVSEIAFELGVEDANYFSRLFRSKFKVSPSQFREETL